MRPVLIQHRGAPTDRPENTMPAYQRGLDIGADGLELDVRASRDGRLFILHDRNLDRTTNGAGPASALTFAELRQLDAGGWFNPSYTGERIPALEEVLRWANGRILLLLDLKGRDPEFDTAVAAEVRKSNRPESVVIGVRSPEQARAFRELIPECRQLAFMETPDLIADFVAARADILRLWLPWLDSDPTLAASVRQSGRLLMINGTRGEPEEARALMRFQPDWILIDDVVKLKRSLASPSMRE